MSTESQHTIELRSDTFTKPSKGMLEAMCKAEVGDSIYDEDPTITLLEKTTAEFFGKEASLFMPSGTMANLVAAMVHCNERSSEMIIGDKSHINLWEQGGVSQIGGIYTRQIKTLEDGTYDLDELETMLPSLDDRCVGNVKMVATENSHNWCGGRIVPLEFFTKLGKLLRERNVKLHVDGSRIATVAVASGIDVKTWVKDCDSINFCFSKACGAPVGSILIGEKSFIQQAVRVRQSLGGGMRQAGVLAACCLYGLERLEENLKKDLANAKRLAEGIHSLRGDGVFSIDYANIDTNIVNMKITQDKLTSAEVIERLQRITKEEKEQLKKSIILKVGEYDKTTARLLTHLDVNADEIELALLKLKFVSAEYAAGKNEL